FSHHEWRRTLASRVPTLSCTPRMGGPPSPAEVTPTFSPWIFSLLGYGVHPRTDSLQNELGQNDPGYFRGLPLVGGPLRSARKRSRVEGDKGTDRAEIRSSRSRSMPNFGSSWVGRPRLGVRASGSAWDCQVRRRPTLRARLLRCRRTDARKVDSTALAL